MKTAIIVDSTAGLRGDQQANKDIFTVDLTINFADGSTMTDTTEEKAVAHFYDQLKQEKDLPTTSQPTLGSYYDLMDDIVAQGYERVFAIHISSPLSGTFSTAKIVTDDYKDRMEIHCIDTKTISIVVQGMVRNLVTALELGKSSDEIMTMIHYLMDESEIYVIVDDLTNLKKGGRLSATSAALGGLLRIKPLLTIEADGKLVLSEKIRTAKKAYKRYVEIIEEYSQAHPQGIVVNFAHADALDVANTVKELIKEALPGLEIDIQPLTPVIGVHVANGALAMSVMPKVKL